MDNYCDDINTILTQYLTASKWMLCMCTTHQHFITNDMVTITIGQAYRYVKEYQFVKKDNCGDVA